MALHPCLPRLATLIAAQCIFAAAITPWIFDNSTFHRRSMLDDPDNFIEMDFSSIKRIAAIGDSYSAGIGAGDRLGTFTPGNLFGQNDYACSRYSHAYPKLVVEGLGDSAERKFQFKSCSGAVVSDLVREQVPVLDGDQQVILLSVGGNDAELLNVLNQCIYQWGALSPSVARLGKIASLVQPEFAALRYLPWDVAGRGCDEQLQITRNIIDSAEFGVSLDRLLVATKAKLGPGGKIYWTGYAKFWAEELSSDCDDVSWAIWPSLLYKAVGKKEALTRENRRVMNELVDKMNSQLASAAQRAGGSVIFVDYDSYMGRFSGRFCETGVQEFNNHDTDAKFGRSFHPQIGLHQMIANLVLFNMANKNLRDHGSPTVPEIGQMESCPLTPPPTSDSSDWTKPFITKGDMRNQQIALASYVSPAEKPHVWEQILGFPSDKVSILVANRYSGPDVIADEGWRTVIRRAHQKGTRVLGYVRTGYLGVSIQKFETRLGSTDLADWVAQIQMDVDLWYSLYPGLIGGIFLDEGWNQCGENNEYSDLYRFISQWIKRKYGDAYIVLNPGSTMPQCFEHSADTLMTFEQNYTTYRNEYIPNNWVAKDPQKIWHIIYNVPKGREVEAAALARDRGAGFIHITDGNLPNPYNTLPDPTYMQNLMNAVRGGKPKPGAPGAVSHRGFETLNTPVLKTSAFDYSSATLTWPGSGTPYAFIILRDGIEAARLPGTMSHVTIGNLKPGGKVYSFSMRAVDQSGMQSGESNKVSVKTMPLPENKAINNVASTLSTGQTIYRADILVPFGFARIYITDPDRKCNLPAWPMSYDTKGHIVCAHYMVEEGVLYQYTGTNKDDKGNWPFSWSRISEVEVKRERYAFTWTLPIGTDTVDTKYYVVQGQGYSPLTNVFVPCAANWKDKNAVEGAACSGRYYDCQGAVRCGLVQRAWCDKAINNMQRGNRVYTAGQELSASGNCWASGEEGCKVYIQGTDENGNNCTMTGD